MIWIIIELLFPILLIVLPLALYKSNRPFMAKFCLRMTASESVRKFYTQSMFILLLLYHYVYAGGHFGEWGIVLSTIPCAAMFSFRRADCWMRKLHDDRKCFVLTALLALAICAVPHLHTLAVTLAFFLLAAVFYPSSGVLAGWQNEETRTHLKENHEALSDYYYQHHHAKLPRIRG